MKKLICIIIAIVSLNASAQQDKHFSMFFNNHMQFNPGAAGHFGGDIRIFTNFRTQWFTVPNQAFRTISASVDGKLLNKEIDNGFIGAGLQVVNDVSGDGKFTVNYITVPINYSIQVNRKSYFSLGLQPGMYAQHLSGDALYFQNQWTGSNFDSALPTGENLGGSATSKFDLGAGLYYIFSPKSNSTIELGLSGLHLSKQSVGFYQNSEKLYRNFTFFGKGDFKQTNSDWSIHPAFIAMVQGPNYEITFGSNFDYILKPSSKHTMYFDGMSISFGFYYRAMDAFIGNLVYNAGPLSIGVSYDTNISGLTAATKGVGAVEGFLRFTPSLNRSLGAPRIR